MDNARHTIHARATEQVAMTQERTQEQERIRTFEEFWPYYVGEHSKKATRIFHFAGTTFAVGALTAGVLLRKRWLIALAPVAGYGPAWFSHFFIENNKPATFKYPLWSLRADLVMWSKMLTGTMDAEVERVISRKHQEQQAPEHTVGVS